MKCVLITGVAGFLGRYIARHFYQRGWQVVGIDTSSPENAPIGVLKQYYSICLPCKREFDALLDRHSPDACVHCAGRASVGLSMSEPAEDFYANTLVTFEILNALRLHAPGCQFVFLSSAAIYGNPISLPIEESQHSSPVSPYGFHKLYSEGLCLEYSKIYNLRTASLRIFSAYGPGLRRQVIWDICQKILSQNQLTLQGTGQESRDFIHAIDIAKAVEFVINCAPMTGEMYNLASGEEWKICDIATLIMHSLGVEYPISFDGILTPGNPIRWQASITKLQALGFSTSIHIEQGIPTFCNWFRAEWEGVEQQHS
jgi:UDP-glucose 4-epimerase